AATEVRRAFNALQQDAVLQFAIRPDSLDEAVCSTSSDLDEGLILLHLDSADLVFRDLADAAEHRDDPAWLGALAAASRHREPDAVTEFVARTCRTRITVALFAATHRCANGLQFDQVLWSRLANARHTN